MEPSRTHRLGRMARVARLTRLALDLGIGSLAYYGCVLAGLDTLPALLAATGVAAVWLVAGALHDRRADGLAAAMLLMYGLSAAFAAATSQPRLLLLRDPLVSALAGLVFLGSCLSGTPATAYLARKLHGHPLDDPRLRRAHLTQTLVLGTGLTVEALARVLLVCVLPVSTGAAITPPLEFVVLVPLVAWTIVQRRRIAARSRVAATGSADEGGGGSRLSYGADGPRLSYGTGGSRLSYGSDGPTLPHGSDEPTLSYRSDGPTLPYGSDRPTPSLGTDGTDRSRLSPGPGPGVVEQYTGGAR